MREMVILIDSGKLTMNLAKKALTKMLESGDPVTSFVSESDMAGIPQEEIEKICAEAISSNANAVKDYLGGKEKAIKAILGSVMKQTRGRGNAQEIEKTLISLINKN